MTALLVAGLASCGKITVEDGVFAFEASVSRENDADILVLNMPRGRTSDTYTMTYVIDNDKTLQLKDGASAVSSPYRFTVGPNRMVKLELPALEVGAHTAVLEFTCGKTNQIQNLEFPFEIAAVPVTGIKPEKDNLSLSVGGSEMVSVDVTPDDATDKTLIAVSSNPEVVEARIAESTAGQARQTLSLTALSKGDAIVTLTDADGKVTAGVGVTVK